MGGLERKNRCDLYPFFFTLSLHLYIKCPPFIKEGCQRNWYNWFFFLFSVITDMTCNSFSPYLYPPQFSYEMIEGLPWPDILHFNQCTPIAAE